MSHQSPKPLPFFHSYSSRSKHVAASACNAGPHISDFPSTSLNPFPFQRPPAPVADTSARPPLLAVQAAQALQLFSLNITKTPWPVATAAEASVKLPPLATQALACLFLMLLLTPFPFQLPLAPITDASVKLPLLAVQTTQALQDVTNPHSLPMTYSS